MPIKNPSPSSPSPVPPVSGDEREEVPLSVMGWGSPVSEPLSKDAATEKVKALESLFQYDPSVQGVTVGEYTESKVFVVTIKVPYRIEEGSEKE